MRVYCEVLILLFRICDTLKELKDMKENER